MIQSTDYITDSRPVYYIKDVLNEIKHCIEPSACGTLCTLLLTMLLSVFCAQVNSRFGQVSNVTGDVEGLISVHPDLPGFGEFRRSKFKTNVQLEGACVEWRVA